MTGVGGTGVVTVGAVIAMAAHLEGKSASVLDFMGFAQKGGAVLSFVRLADTPERLNQVRIDTQQADAILACDVVVGASADALQTVRHGRTRILANMHEIPVAESLRNPDADLKTALLLEKMRFVAGRDQVQTFRRPDPGRGVSRRHAGLEHPGRRLCLAMRADPAEPGGADPRDRTQRCRRGVEL